MSGPEPGRRLFFAFWPDETTRQSMVHAARKAVRGSGGRPVPAHNLHITLAFLGFVPESQVAAVARAAAGLKASPLAFVFDSIAHWTRPQVLVATSSRTTPEAGTLGIQLWSRLAPLGLKPDPRPFLAHVTLARKVRRPSTGLTLPPICWPAPALALVESVTDPSGAQYHVLQQFPLG
jgi:2'-5' RNA ligase